MIDFLLGNSNQSEAKRIVEISRSYAARLSEEKWQYHWYMESQKLIEFLEENNLVDMACLDVSMEHGIALAEKTRKSNEQAFILLVADKTMSPMKYIKPSIMAGALLLKPYTLQQAKEVIKDSIQTFMEEFSRENNREQFVIDNKEGRQVISYSQINFFEARDKKIYVNTGAKEMVFYDTIENLEQQLPDIFIRCHRSFIVSRIKVEKIFLSQNTIMLKDGSYVPLSRTYKKAIKEWK